MAIIDETIYGLKGKQVTQTVEAIKENTSDIAGLETTVAGKQDALSATQLTAVNSGIDTTKVAQIATNVTDIDTIEGKIPAQATSSNQLADKAFVNSSVATNTANFVGTFNTIEELEAVQNPTNNDYGFVISTQSGNTVYNRYKFNGTAWAFEYALNNSSFTAEQWAAIQSGITAGLVTKLNNIEAGAEVNDIDSISVNGTAVTPDANKNVDLTIENSLSGNSAPTTSTEGTLGQTYVDTSTGDIYFLSEIDETTSPAIYTWSKIAKTGEIPTTTSQLTNNGSDGTHRFLDSTFPFAANDTKQSIIGGYNASGLSKFGAVALGDSANAAGDNSIAIGVRASARGDESISIASSVSGQGAMSVAYANYGIAIGYTSRVGYGTDDTKSKGSVALGYRAHAGSIVDAPYSVALGAHSYTAQKGQVDISTFEAGGTSSTYGYNNSPYRLLTGLYDPQSDHDAATKEYVDSVAPVITMTNTDPGEGAALAANHFIAYYE